MVIRSGLVKILKKNSTLIVLNYSRIVDCLQKAISKLQAKIKAIQEGMHWDKLAIESWLEDAIVKDDDAMILQSSMHDDATKIKVRQVQQY